MLRAGDLQNIYTYSGLWYRNVFGAAASAENTKRINSFCNLIDT